MFVKPSKKWRNPEGNDAIMVLAAVVNREGLLVRTQIFEGNRQDVTTLEDVISSMEKDMPEAWATGPYDRQDFYFRTYAGRDIGILLLSVHILDAVFPDSQAKEDKLTRAI